MPQEFLPANIAILISIVSGKSLADVRKMLSGLVDGYQVIPIHVGFEKLLTGPGQDPARDVTPMTWSIDIGDHGLLFGGRDRGLTRPLLDLTLQLLLRNSCRRTDAILLRWSTRASGQQQDNDQQRKTLETFHVRPPASRGNRPADYTPCPCGMGSGGAESMSRINATLARILGHLPQNYLPGLLEPA